MKIKVLYVLILVLGLLFAFLSYPTEREQKRRAALANIPLNKIHSPQNTH